MGVRLPNSCKGRVPGLEPFPQPGNGPAPELASGLVPASVLAPVNVLLPVSGL